MGVSLSTMITLGSNVLILIIYCWKCSEYHIAPLPSNLSTLLNREDVKIYLSIGGPSVLMIMAEWLVVEVLIVMAASISMGAVGAMSVSYTYFNLIWAFPFGF